MLNSTDLFSVVDDLSPDGSTVVGYIRDQNSVDHPVRWIQDGTVVEDLGLVPNWTGSQQIRCWNTSGDGTIIIATDYIQSVFYPYFDPILWTKRTGWVTLDDALYDFWSYSNYTNNGSVYIYISADDHTIASQNWCVTFPNVVGHPDGYYVAAGQTIHVPASRGVLANDVNVSRGGVAVAGIPPQHGNLALNP